jgi:hypothetical protein
VPTIVEIETGIVNSHIYVDERERQNADNASIYTNTVHVEVVQSGIYVVLESNIIIIAVENKISGVDVDYNFEQAATGSKAITAMLAREAARNFVAPITVRAVFNESRRKEYRKDFMYFYANGARFKSEIDFVKSGKEYIDVRVRDDCRSMYGRDDNFSSVSLNVKSLFKKVNGDFTTVSTKVGNWTILASLSDEAINRVLEAEGFAKTPAEYVEELNKLRKANKEANEEITELEKKLRSNELGVKLRETTLETKQVELETKTISASKSSSADDYKTIAAIASVATAFVGLAIKFLTSKAVVPVLAVSTVRSVASSAIGAVKDVASSAVSFASDVASSAIDTAKDVASSAIDFASDVASSAIDTISDTFSSACDFFSLAW